jgi:hypothetical protein
MLADNDRSKWVLSPALATGASFSAGSSSSPPPSGVLLSENMDWNSGLWLRLRCGLMASTTCSNGSS